MSTDIQIRKTFGLEAIEIVRQLRYAVLREPLQLSFESTSFSGDELDSTLHFLACDPSGTALGCVTLLAESKSAAGVSNDRSIRTAQMRGMAVSLHHQRRGIGARLLDAVHAVARESNVDLWCNARCSAAEFYRRNGWYVDSDVFDIAHIGPHVVMRWALPSAKP